MGRFQSIGAANKLFSLIYGTEKFAGKVPSILGGAAATAGGYALIDKLRGR